MFESFSRKAKDNTESTDLIKKNILAAKIDQVATNVRNLLYLNQEKPDINSNVLEKINSLENNLEAIESKIREMPSNSEEDRGALELKVSELNELHQKIKDLITEN